MKVFELIRELEELPSDAEVITTTSNFEQGHSNISAKYVHFYSTGDKQMENFRDAFDGIKYSSEVYSILGGNLPIVKIS